jgi:1,2-phenylacetyl-CoA epoxidase catalytic subunit
LGLQAVVRPARGEVLADFWEGPEIGHLKSVEVESSDGKFTDALDRNRPMFLASWGSTTLVEALQIGIIPIVVATRNDRWVEDTLYPLLECCLHWPTDEAMIERAVSDRTSYQRTLDDLREKALALN